MQGLDLKEREDVGVVLGSRDSAPLSFWVGVRAGATVQLDDLIVVDTQTPDGRPIAYFGIVDEVAKRFEGQTYDTDAFLVAENALPAEVAYVAHVQVTRLEPEVFVPPHPGSTAAVVHGEAYQRALSFDTMERKAVIGITRTGEAVYANLEFLDGTRGAHASISGVSGVATKTSYATFLLYSLFHSDALGADATNSKAIIFNVKGEDLLWLDQPNSKLSEEARAQYERLGLPVGPFRSVRLFAPAKRGDRIAPDTGGRFEGVDPYVWSLRQFARERLLRFAFAGAEDARQQLSFVVTRVERVLEKAAQEGNLQDPTIEVAGTRLHDFQELTDLLDGGALDQMAPNAASGTLDAFRRRLHAAAHHMGHLVRGDEEAAKYPIDWRSSQVTVIDIHRLHATAQLFVVGAILKRAMEEKEAKGTSKPLQFIVLDELNKYAPRQGWSPIQETLLDIAERGRSLGVSLFGAQQTASEVERRVVSNAALRVVGRLDAAEAERDEYRFLGRATRTRATVLQPGSMIVSQPEIPVPILLRFPFPAWATRASEADRDFDEDELFSRMGE
ncbi:MAG: ATP-binding protein [Acidobacteria bacterium]|nr:ATP-binding protein [Acidobacteriota bacterium]